MSLPIHWKRAASQWLMLASLVGVVFLWPRGAAADNCHVEQIIYRSGPEIHFSATGDSNVAYPPGKNLPTENVSIEMVFNVPMRFETFHPYSVYIRQVSDGSLLNSEYTKGDMRDEQDHPRSVIIIIQESLDSGAHYELIVQGWDLVPSGNATVANAAKPIPDGAMRHSLQWVFETVAAVEEAETQPTNRTFYMP